MTMITTNFLHVYIVYYKVMVTNHPEVMRKLHVRCTGSSKFLKKVAFITDELDVSWVPGIISAFSRDDSPQVTTYALLELSSFADDSS